MRIYLVRHGETNWNKDSRIMGHLPIPLNKKGENEAKDLAEALSLLQKTRVFSSDILRAKQTAEIINKKVKGRIYYNEGLREKGGGKIEGEYWTEEHSKMSFEEWEKIVEKMGGESIEGFEQRVWSSFSEIVQDNFNQEKIVVVSHGGPIKIIIKNIFGTDNSIHRKIRIYNCSITIIEALKEENKIGYNIHTINSFSHLKQKSI